MWRGKDDGITLMSMATLSPATTSTAKPDPAPRLGVLVIGRKRPGFDQEWNAIMRRRTSAALEEMGYDCVGADLAVIDDDTIVTAIEQIRAAGAEALLVLQPSLGNG